MEDVPPGVLLFECIKLRAGVRDAVAAQEHERAADETKRLRKYLAARVRGLGAHGELAACGLLLNEIATTLAGARPADRLIDELVELARAIERRDTDQRRRELDELDEAFETASEYWLELGVNEVARRLGKKGATASKRLKRWATEGLARKVNRQRWLVSPRAFAPV